MIFYAVNDLHGTVPKKPSKDFDAVICAGDLGEFKHIRELIFKEAAGEFNEPWYDEVGRDKAKQMIQKTLKSGRKVIKKMNSWGKPIVIVPGNADFYGERFLRRVDKNTVYYWDYYFKDHFEEMIKGCDKVVNVHLRRGVFRELTFVGYGVTSGPEGELTEEGLVLDPGFQSIMQKLEALVRMSRPKNKLVLLSHNVPNETRLDLVGSQHYGSHIVRYLIEKYQPLLSVGGHVHENQGEQNIKKTLCVNPGHGAEGEAAFIEISGEGVEASFVK